MPKARHARVKLHDFAPGSARRKSAAHPPARLLVLPAGNGHRDASNTSVAEFDAISSHSRNATAEGNPGCSVPAANHAYARASGELGVAAQGQPSVAASIFTLQKCLSRGQRRRAEKRDAWLRKFEFAKYAQELRDEQRRRQEDTNQQDGLLSTFSVALRQELPGSDTDGYTTSQAAARGPRRVTLKDMQNIAKKEIAQYNAVLALPAFHASPLSALKDHLRNVIRVQRRTRGYV